MLDKNTAGNGKEKVLDSMNTAKKKMDRVRHASMTIPLKSSDCLVIS